MLYDACAHFVAVLRNCLCLAHQRSSSWGCKLRVMFTTTGQAVFQVQLQLASGPVLTRDIFRCSWPRIYKQLASINARRFVKEENLAPARFFFSAPRQEGKNIIHSHQSNTRLFHSLTLSLDSLTNTTSTGTEVVGYSQVTSGRQHWANLWHAPRRSGH